ncbi:hypothetical protein B0H12DRAFT_1277530 [Mycena haematopus]|nr:hypothetical protein B0H12DRAFT_1277530 [Mycena haematopus]
MKWGGGSYNFHESGVRRGEGIIGEQSEKEWNGNRGSTSREARDSHKVVCCLGERRHREVNAPKHVSRFRTLRGLVQLVDNLKVDEVLQPPWQQRWRAPFRLSRCVLSPRGQEGRVPPALPSSRKLSVALVRQSSSRATPMEFDMDMLKPEETESARERILPATLVRHAGRVLCDTCDMQPNLETAGGGEPWSCQIRLFSRMKNLKNLNGGSGPPVQIIIYLSFIVGSKLEIPRSKADGVLMAASASLPGNSKIF